MLLSMQQHQPRGLPHYPYTQSLRHRTTSDPYSNTDTTPAAAAATGYYYHHHYPPMDIPAAAQYQQHQQSVYNTGADSPTHSDTSECCGSPHLSSYGDQQQDTNTYTMEGSPLSPSNTALLPNSPHESLSPTINVSDCQSPCGSIAAHHTYTAETSSTSGVDPLDSPPSTSTQYNDGSCSDSVDPYHKQYYPSVGYGSAAVGPYHTDTTPYQLSYDTSSYSGSSPAAGYCTSNYITNGYGYPNTNSSPYAAYYTNYYSASNHPQYSVTGNGNNTSTSCTSGVTSSSTYSSTADGYMLGYPYSSNSTNTSGQQSTSSLWNYSGNTSAVGSLAGHQYSKVSYDTPRFKLTPERAIPLVKWFEEHKDHPYPSRHEKMVLCQSTQLTFTQVSTWFANARRRMKKAANEDGEEEDEILSDEDK